MTSAPHPRAGTLSIVAVTLLGLGCSLLGVTCPTDTGAPRQIAEPEPIPGSTYPIILTPSEHQTVTAGTAIPVAYQIANPIDDVIVSAYLERADLGTQVATQANLSAVSLTVYLSTAGLASGLYYPTVALDNGVSRTVTRASTTSDEDVTIQVRAGGAITFLGPTTSGPFAVGEQINISFVMTNTSTAADYRVFFDNDGVLSGNESLIDVSLIDVGRGTETSVVWNTTGLLPGIYFVGVTIESTGLSTTEYADTFVRLDEPPAILVTAPALDRIVGPADTVEVRFLAADPDSDAHINVFVDQDGLFSSGDEQVVGRDLPITQTSFSLALATAQLAPGAYFIGASLNPDDQVSPADFDYAAGKIQIVGGDAPAIALVSVTACDATPCPDADSDQPLQNLFLDNASGLKVVWRAFDANSERVDMAVYLDPDRFPLSGNELLLDERVGEAGPLPVEGAMFEWPSEESEFRSLAEVGVRPGQLYNYLLVVRDANPNDTGSTWNTTYGLATLLIAGRDIGTRWLGHTGAEISGARITGQATGDQVGSGILGIGDRNGDLLDDYLVLARFGAGGAGRAVLAFGSGSRTTGTDVPFDELDGNTYTGIGGDEALGMVDVAVLPDVDGDARSELVFAFPHVDSASPDVLAAAGHFDAGGIVVVSSLNDSDEPVGISLNSVGRNFNCTEGKRCPSAHNNSPDEICNALWKPQDDPGAECFRTPLTLADCTEDPGPECPCAYPGAYPGMWPGGVKDDGWSLDDVQQGQLPPYGARILGPRTGWHQWPFIDCDEDGEPDEDPSYEQIYRAFDPNGRFGSALATSALGANSPLIVADPREGDSGAIYVISPTNWWKTRLETADGACIWGTDADVCLEQIDTDFPLPRPHQYLAGGKHVGASRFIGPAGSEMSTVASWNVDSDLDADIVVGAPGHDQDGRVDTGALYVLLGKDTGGSVDVDEVVDDNTTPFGDGTIRGTKIVARAGERLGEVQPQVGDFDGDNRTDLVIGIPRYCDGDPDTATCGQRVGAVLVIFGGLDLDGNGRLDLVERPDPRENPWEIAELLAARLAILIKGEVEPSEASLAGGTPCPDGLADNESWTGYAIASPGDMDGDFVHDIMFSAPGADHTFETVLTEPAVAGENKVFVRSAEGMAVRSRIRISTPSGSECRTVRSISTTTNPLTGEVSYLLTLNELLAFDHPLVDGQREVTARLIDAGKVFVFYGRRDLRDPASLSTTIFEDGVYSVTEAGTADLPSTVYIGRETADYAGGADSLTEEGLGSRRFFSTAGDIDDDGQTDLLIGSPLADPFNREDAGEVYLIYGGQ